MKAKYAEDVYFMYDKSQRLRFLLRHLQGDVKMFHKKNVFKEKKMEQKMKQKMKRYHCVLLSLIDFNFKI